MGWKDGDEEAVTACAGTTRTHARTHTHVRACTAGEWLNIHRGETAYV